MSKRGPKPGRIKRKVEAARKQGQAQAFGVANKKSKEEGLVSRVVRKVTNEGLLDKR